jgi:hypothetical protein
VEYEYPALETAEVLEDLSTPYPVYGRVKDKEGNLKPDVLVYLHLEEGGKKSQLISTVTSDTAGWSLDLANIREENLEEMFRDRIYKVYLDFYSGFEKKEGAYVDAMKLQPVEDMVLMEELESEEGESSSDFFRSIVGPVYAQTCPSGQWECMGKCADSGIQQMFNGTWCDGHGRWLWEAANYSGTCGGNPSRLISEGCGGAPPAPPAPPPPAGCPSGQWECMGACADSGIQQMFNGTWCDGHARWLWEAAGNTNRCGGNPSKLRSEGCGGAPPSPTPPPTGCKSGEWKCGESCADSGIQQLFNNTWCDGHARWLWEAAGNTNRCGGNPSKLRSEGCDGAPTPTPTPTPAGCKSGEWECGESCADSGIQQLFSNTWCDGHARWLWEAAGNTSGCGGNPSKLRSEGCGGSINPPPPQEPTIPTTPTCSATQCLDQGQCWPLEEYDEHNPFGGQMGCSYGRVRRARRSDGACYFELVKCYDQPPAPPTVDACSATNQCYDVDNRVCSQTGTITGSLQGCSRGTIQVSRGGSGTCVYVLLSCDGPLPEPPDPPSSLPPTPVGGITCPKQIGYWTGFCVMVGGTCHKVTQLSDNGHKNSIDIGWHDPSVSFEGTNLTSTFIGSGFRCESVGFHVDPDGTPGYGCRAILRKGAFVYYLAHLKGGSSSCASDVNCGYLIGGNTGNTTGPHLHFEVLDNDMYSGTAKKTQKYNACHHYPGGCFPCSNPPKAAVGTSAISTELPKSGGVYAQEAEGDALNEDFVETTSNPDETIEQLNQYWEGKEKLDKGVYQISGKDVTTKILEVNSDDTYYIYFYDSNGNGTYDQGEQYLSDLEAEGLKEEIEFEKVADFVDYNFKVGWNLFAFPFVMQGENTSEIVKASELLHKANEEGAYVTHVATYRHGQWMIYSERGGISFSMDFNVLPGEGYFLKNYNATTFGLKGKEILDPVPLDLEVGWNLIGIVSPDQEYTAETLIDAAVAEGITADTVTRWESGKYENFIKEEGVSFGRDFTIFEIGGYFVRVRDKGGRFTP